MFHKTSKAPPEACSRRHRARGAVTHGGGASAEGIGEEDRRERQACERAETLRHTRCGTPAGRRSVHVALLGGPGHHPRRARPGEPLPQVRALGIGRRVGDRAVPQHGRAGEGPGGLSALHGRRARRAAGGNRTRHRRAAARARGCAGQDRRAACAVRLRARARAGRHAAGRAAVLAASGRGKRRAVVLAHLRRGPLCRLHRTRREGRGGDGRLGGEGPAGRRPLRCAKDGLRG